MAIATRNHLHARQTISAIEHKKHVFCEKPLCLTEEELRAIVQAYTQNDAPHPLLMVGFNRRFAPMISQMRSFLEQISEPLALTYRINAGHLAPDHWMNDPEQGGGRILGEVCHFIDLLAFLARSPIVEVTGRRIGNSARYSGGNAFLSLSFANGSQGTISYLANGDRSFSKERIEVFGGGSTAVLEDFRRLELVRNGWKQTIRSRWRQDKGHQAEWAAFVAAVQGSTAPPIPFEEIVRSTMATLCAQKSLTTGIPITVTAPSVDLVPIPTLSLTHSR